MAVVGKIRARVEGKEWEGKLIRVPILFDGQVPDVPKLVQIGPSFFLLTGTNPVTYKTVEVFQGELL